MNRTRAFRRHKERMKKKWAERTFWWTSDLPEADRKSVVGKQAHTPKQCSNPMCCGNRRTYEGPTLDEIRATLNFEEQLVELEDEK